MATPPSGPLLLPAPVDLSDLLPSPPDRDIILGLERLRPALAEGGHPERRFPALQVAGTNGKGSITTFLVAVLQAAGLRCGAYRSPHLVSWCERISLDGRWIEAETLRRDLERWRPIAERHRLTCFELFTAAAFDRFAASELDLVVLEVGLGGRLDATTVHPQRPVVGFAAIGLDHCERLGPDLTAIAGEKAGVLAEGIVAISAPQPEEAARVLEAEAQRRGAELRWVDPLPDPSCGGPRLGLEGSFQRANAAVAVAMAHALAERAWPRPDRPLQEQAVLEGLAAARWPGRLEQRHFRGQPLLLDGAHNPPAAQVLRRELDALAPGPRRWLLGIQRHKDAAAILQLLLAPGDRALVVPIPDHASWSRQELAGACPSLADQLVAVADVPAGLLELLAPGVGGPAIGGEAGAPEPCPVVAGSLVLLGAVIPWLDGSSDQPKG